MTAALLGELKGRWESDKEGGWSWGEGWKR